MKIENLQKTIADMFNRASSKEEIDNLSTIKAQVDEAIVEQEELLKAHNELLQSYKDVIIHQSYKPEQQVVKQETPVTESLDFTESILQDLLK